jgi:hypothetical protein
LVVYKGDMTTQKYANFPERELKVVLGPNINAQITKLIGKLSIGSYEMTVGQQEKIQASVSNARLALNIIAREMQLSASASDNRDFACAFKAENGEHCFQIWVTTPYEGGQTSHLVWTKYSDLTAPRKIGVACKVGTAFTMDDMVAQLKQAQKNVVELQADEPYTLKGNPPPRFAKKTPAAAAPAKAAEAPSATDQPSA